MYVLSQQEAVAWAVASALRIRADVGSIEHVKHVRVRQGTLPVVQIGHDDSERTLPKSRQNHLRLTEPRPVVDQFRFQRRHGTRLQPQLHKLIWPGRTREV